MAALDSQIDLIKALLVQNGGSAFVSREALRQAMGLDLDVQADEKGLTLTVKKPAKAPHPKR